ncbi:hypothetical protein [Streptomyces sp. NPDC017991]
MIEAWLTVVLANGIRFTELRRLVTSAGCRQAPDECLRRLSPPR